MKKLLLLIVLLQPPTVYAMRHTELLACQIKCLNLYHQQASKTDGMLGRLNTIAEKDAVSYVMEMSNHAQTFIQCLKLCELKYTPNKDFVTGHRSPRYFEDEE